MAHHGSAHPCPPPEQPEQPQQQRAWFLACLRKAAAQLRARDCHSAAPLPPISRTACSDGRAALQARANPCDMPCRRQVRQCNAPKAGGAQDRQEDTRGMSWPHTHTHTHTQTHTHVVATARETWRQLEATAMLSTEQEAAAILGAVGPLVDPRSVAHACARDRAAAAAAAAAAARAAAAAAAAAAAGASGAACRTRWRALGKQGSTAEGSTAARKHGRRKHGSKEARQQGSYAAMLLCWPSQHAAGLGYVDATLPIPGTPKLSPGVRINRQRP